MSKIQFGLPLTVPSKQTLIPIVQPTGRIFGFFPIAEHTFEGTETTYTLSQGSIPITTVTLPSMVQTNHNDARVQQYMAAQWPDSEEALAPWKGYSELVAVNDNNTLGFYSWWSMPVTSWFHHFGVGSYIGSLMQGMSNFSFVPTTGNPPDVTTPQSLEWACTLNMASFASDCSFFDFQWPALLEAQLQADPTTEGSTVIPLSIQVTSNPEGGFFKASVLQGLGGQTIVPGGGVMFNTIRILRLQDPTAGTYVFDFSVSANINGVVMTTPAVLNLVVV